MNTQQIASIGRQALALIGVVMGALTQTVSAIHLPVAISAMLAATYPVILGLEHYVSDPSTGSTPPVVVPPGPVQALQYPQPTLAPPTTGPTTTAGFPAVPS